MRSEGGLVSALAEPFQSAGIRPRYPTVRRKAAALFRNLAKSQHLIDGNKRLAITTLTVFLRLNGYETTYTNSELYRYALHVARYRGNFPLGRIHRWITRHTREADATTLEETRRLNQEVYDAAGDLAAFMFGRASIN